MGEINAKASKPVSNYTTSIIFLAVVIIGTLALYFFNGSLSSQVTELDGKISSIEQNIKAVEKDKNLQIYSLLQLNKEAISKFESMNKITDFINHMNLIKGKYGIELEGFNLSNGKIETVIKSISDKEGIAFQKAKDFINKYRADEKAKFDLGFINTVEGMDDMKFKVNFMIK